LRAELFAGVFLAELFAGVFLAELFAGVFLAELFAGVFLSELFAGVFLANVGTFRAIGTGPRERYHGPQQTARRCAGRAFRLASAAGS
jgi:hypothetical protein